MGFMTDLDKYVGNYATGAYLSRNPLLRDQYFDQQEQQRKRNFEQQKIEDARRYQEGQAKQWGEQADTVYGMQAQPGQAGMYAGQHGPTKAGGIISSADAFMDAPNTPSMPSQQQVQAPVQQQDASGVFQGASPEQVRQYELQKRAMQTGMIPGMSMQMGAVNPMQSSSMANEQSGINNVANNQTTLQKQGMADRANMARTLATDAYTQYGKDPAAYEAYMDATSKSKGKESTFTDEMSLRKEYNMGNKSFESLRETMGKMNTAYTINENTGLYEGTGPGDMALITGFQKMLDPSSIVRETEYAQTQETSGFIGGIQAKLEKLKSGKDLTPEQRTELVNQMNKFWEATLTHMRKRKDDYVNLSTDYGFDPTRVVGSIKYADAQQSNVPQQPGTAQAVVNKAVDTAQAAVSGKPDFTGWSIVK